MKIFMQPQYHQDVWRLALPMMLSNLSIPLLGMVDTAVMGHMPGPEYIGAVAIGALIFSYLFWGFAFLRMGTTGLAAQALGAGDYDKLRAIMGQAMLLACVLSIIVLLLQWPILQIGLWLIDASGRVEQLTTDYFSIRIWSVPAILIRFAVLGWLLGLQNARASLYILLIINGLNACLDIILVVYLQYSIIGVAWASLVAEYVGLLCALLLVFKELKHYPGRWLLKDIIDFYQLKRMLLINQDIFIRTLVLMAAFTFFTMQSAEQGDVVLAANSVLLNFLMLMAYGLDGFAQAVEALAGRAVGERNRHRFISYVSICGLWSGLFAIFYALIFWLWGLDIINVLTNLYEVRTVATEYLHWLILLPVIAVWAFWLDGVFIGTTQVVAMRNTMLIAFCLYLLVWFLSQAYANHGLWLAMTAFMAVRGVGLGLAFYRIDKRAGFILSN